VKGQPEKMSLEPCSKLTATDGRGKKVKRQSVPDNWSCDEKAPPTEPSCSHGSRLHTIFIIVVSNEKALHRKQHKTTYQTDAWQRSASTSPADHSVLAH